MIRDKIRMSCPISTRFMKGPDSTGSTKLQSRFTTIKQKLPAISHFRGRISARTSGSTFFSGGLGRFAVISALAARPAPRLGRSPEGTPCPLPIPCDPNEEPILIGVYLVPYSFRHPIPFHPRTEMHHRVI